MEVIGINNKPGLDLMVTSLRLCELRWKHRVVETLVIIVDPHPWTAANISLSGITDILGSYGGLITAERLHRATYMERCRDILQLNLIQLHPKVVDSRLGHHRGKISTRW